MFLRFKLPRQLKKCCGKLKLQEHQKFKSFETTSTLRHYKYSQFSSDLQKANGILMRLISLIIFI